MTGTRRYLKTMRRILLTKDKVFQGDLILVNADYAYRGNVWRKRVDMEGTTLAMEAAAALRRAMQSLNGWESIAAVSGWRSFEEQQAIWDALHPGYRYGHDSRHMPLTAPR